MADADKELKIKIVTEGDTSGAKQVNKELAQGEEHLKLFAGESSEVRRTIRELSHEFPLAAEALRVLTNPVGGTIFAGIFAFRAFKSVLEDWNKEMDEAIAKAADPRWANAIEAKRQAIVAVNKDLAAFRFELQQTESAEKKLAEATAERITAIDQETEATNKLAAAQRELNEARREHAIARGDETPEHGAVAGAIEDISGRHAAAAAEAKAHFEKREATGNELFQARLRAPGLEAATNAAAQAKARADALAAGAAANLPKDQAELEEMKKRRDSLSEELDNTRKKNVMGDPVGQANLDRKRAQLQSDIDEAQASINRRERLIATDKARIDAVNSTGQAFDRAKSDQKENNEAITRLTRELEEMTQKFRGEEKTTADVNAFKDRAALEKSMAGFDRAKFGGMTGADIEKGAQAEMLRQHHQKMTDDQNKLADQFEKFVSQIGGHIEKLLPILNRLLNPIASVGARIDALDRAVKELNDRVRTNQNR